jgi:hypothetical protein
MGPSEALVREASFHRSVTTPWLQLRVRLTTDRLLATDPRVALGFLKVGTYHTSYSLALVTAVQAVSSIGVVRFGLGGLMAIVGAGNIIRPDLAPFDRLFTAAMLVVGLWLFRSAFHAFISVCNESGDAISYGVAWLERGRAAAFAAEVGRVTSQGPWIGLRSRVPPVSRPATVAQSSSSERAAASPPTAALDALEQLANMRARGLITSAEYETKKAEMLSRL